MLQTDTTLKRVAHLTAFEGPGALWKQPSKRGGVALSFLLSDPVHPHIPSCFEEGLWVILGGLGLAGCKIASTLSRPGVFGRSLFSYPVAV